ASSRRSTSSRIRRAWRRSASGCPSSLPRSRNRATTRPAAAASAAPRRSFSGASGSSPAARPSGQTAPAPPQPGPPPLPVVYAPLQRVGTRGSDRDAVEGIVLMRRGQNPSVVLADLRTRIEELNARVLPTGVRVVPFYDRTDLVSTTLKTVFRNIAEGAALVVVVLFAFMLSLRAALSVAAVIPLSLGVSFIYLYGRGMSANLLSMGAVDFGIIVDGAVILVEAIYHRVGGEAEAIRAGRTRTGSVVLEAA